MTRPYCGRRENGWCHNIIAALLYLFIAGCQTLPPKIETIEVSLPVPTPRACPVTLCAPVDYGPMPVFKAGEGDNVTLDAKGQADLRDLILALKGKVDAFQDWATSP